MPRRRMVGLAAVVLLLTAACERPPAPVGAGGGLTWLELTDAATGRTLAAEALPAGAPVTLAWRNSLFRVDVTEGFTARGGRLDLTRVTFTVPGGGTPPRVPAEALDDLYHTGGPFHVDGIARPFTHLLFRIGEIGNPVLTLPGHVVRLKDEVGFGGAVRLEVRRPGWRGLNEALARARDCWGG